MNCHLKLENIYFQDYQEKGCYDGSVLDMTLDRSYLCPLSDSGALDCIQKFIVLDWSRPASY